MRINPETSIKSDDGFGDVLMLLIIEKLSTLKVAFKMEAVKIKSNVLYAIPSSKALPPVYPAL